jgi:hypothetical protein
MNAQPASLWSHLLNIFVSPTEVFDEVFAAPPRLANWLVPTVLVCVAGLFLIGAADSQPQTRAPGPSRSAQGTQTLSERPPMITAVATCAAAGVGSVWCASVLWIISRMFLKARFSFAKAIELVGMAGMIPVLGAIVTALLILATGNPAARPALSLLAGGDSPQSPIFLALDALNFFHLWCIAVLAIGFSRLSGVSLGEAAFWVVGYWLLARLAAILLG